MRHLRLRRNQDGAAAVEFALLFPIFMVLAMGIITVGTAFSRQINITQAAREASRYGATYDITAAGGTTSWLLAVDGALVAAAGAKANPIGGYNYRCVAIVKMTDSATPTVDTAHSSYRAVSDNGTVSTGANSCPGTAAATIRNASYVQSVLSRKVAFNVIFIHPNIDVDAVSTTPYEGDLP